MADTANDVRVVAATEPDRSPPRERAWGPDGREVDLSVQFIELMNKLGIADVVVRVGLARRPGKP